MPTGKPDQVTWDTLVAMPRRRGKTGGGHRRRTCGAACVQAEVRVGGRSRAQARGED